MCAGGGRLIGRLCNPPAMAADPPCARYLVLDTETTGLFRPGRSPPRLVEAGWLVCDERGRVLERGHDVVAPSGFAIPVAASRVHGITTAVARREGVPVAGVLHALGCASIGVSAVVAHNLRFDRAVVAGECRRACVPDPLASLSGFCTMESGAFLCGVRWQGSYKWPTLGELHLALFGEPCAGIHRAMEDAEACARCFFELKKRGVFGV